MTIGPKAIGSALVGVSLLAGGFVGLAAAGAEASTTCIPSATVSSATVVRTSSVTRTAVVSVQVRKVKRKRVASLTARATTTSRVRVALEGNYAVCGPGVTEMSSVVVRSTSTSTTASAKASARTKAKAVRAARTRATKAVKAKKAAARRVARNEDAAVQSALESFLAALKKKAGVVAHDPKVPVTAASVAATRDRIVAEVVRLGNVERVKAGRQPLIPVSALNAVAQDWTDYLIREDLFEHSPNTGTKVGLAGCDYAPDWAARGTYSRDNLGKSWGWFGLGSAMADDVATGMVNAWMDSTGHRASLLDPDVSYTGVGASYRASDGVWIVSHLFTSRDCSALVSR